MKIRNGFVSNSSSTSFYISAKEYSEDAVKEIITKMIEVYHLINKDSDLHMDDICHIYESDNETVAKRITDYFEYGVSKKEKEKRFNDRKELYPEKIIVVDSIRDNSIPWPIQEILENIGNRVRYG